MPASTAQSPGLLQKIITVLLSIGLLIIGFMFSLVVVGIVAVLGLLAWGYLYWKTRALRKAMQTAASESNVIDGEAHVIREPYIDGEVLLQAPADKEKH